MDSTTTSLLAGNDNETMGEFHSNNRKGQNQFYWNSCMRAQRWSGFVVTFWDPGRRGYSREWWEWRQWCTGIGLARDDEDDGRMYNSHRYMEGGRWRYENDSHSQRRSSEFNLLVSEGRGEGWRTQVVVIVQSRIEGIMRFGSGSFGKTVSLKEPKASIIFFKNGWNKLSVLNAPVYLI